MAEVFENAANMLEDHHYGFWAGEAGIFWKEVGEPGRALPLEIREIKLLEKYKPDSEEIAAGYNNLGYTYDELGDYEQALECKLKALGICRRILGSDHLNLATVYDNVGLSYGAMGDYDRALEHHLKALSIFEGALGENHQLLATSYSNMGVAYGNLGEHEKALEYNLKAIAIREQVLPSERQQAVS
jgi:preprotein translocase subunit SecA/nephrocystin-3